MLKINCNYKEEDYLLIEKDECCKEDEISFNIKESSIGVDLCVYVTKEKAIKVCELLKKFIEGGI